MQTNLRTWVTLAILMSGVVITCLGTVTAIVLLGALDPGQSVYLVPIIIGLVTPTVVTLVSVIARRMGDDDDDDDTPDNGRMTELMSRLEIRLAETSHENRAKGGSEKEIEKS